VSSELNPMPAPVRTVVTPVRAPAPAPTLGFSVGRAEAATPVLAPVDPGQKVHPDELASPPRTPVMTVEPKTAEQTRLHITVPRGLLRKLEAARDALSHSHPGGSEAEVLGRPRPHPRALGEAARDRGEAARGSDHDRRDGAGSRRACAACFASLDGAQPPRPRRGLAHRLGARPRVLRLAARERRRLPLHPPARAGPHPRVGARREQHGRRVPPPLPLPPGRLGAAPLRRRSHEHLHPAQGRDVFGAGRGLRDPRARSVLDDRLRGVAYRGPQAR
jgi:hypothetical protein